MKHNPARRPASAALSIGWMVAATAFTASASPMSEHFESTLSRWQTTGMWGTTNTRAWSPTHSVTDTPGAFYANNTDASLTLSSSIDLTTLPRPALAFHHAHELDRQHGRAGA